MKTIRALTCVSLLLTASVIVLAQANMDAQQDSSTGSSSAPGMAPAMASGAPTKLMPDERAPHLQGGTLSNGSGSATRNDTMATIPGGKGPNDPTNPAAKGATAGAPQNY